MMFYISIRNYAIKINQLYIKSLLNYKLQFPPTFNEITLIFKANKFFLFMLFLISYKFSDASSQEKGAKMLTECYDKERPQNRSEGYDVKSWIFLPQHGKGYSLVNDDSLETIWRQWRPWRQLMEINIEPSTDLDEIVALYR